MRSRLPGSPNSVPTLADGEALADLRTEQHDLATRYARHAFERPDQLAWST